VNKEKDARIYFSQYPALVTNLMKVLNRTNIDRVAVCWILMRSQIAHLVCHVVVLVGIKEVIRLFESLC